MATGAIRRMGLAEWIMLLSLAAIWGGSFFFNKIALHGLPPLVVVWGRTCVGSLAVLALIALARMSVREYLGRWKDFIVLGVLNTLVPFSLIVWGQQYIDSGLAAVINATTPAFTVLVANFFTTDEKSSIPKFAGALIGLGGVATLIGTDALSGFGSHILAQAAVMGAAMSYACSATYARRMAAIPPLILAGAQLTVSCLLMTPIMLIFNPIWTLPFPGYDALAAVAGLGLICSALAYILFFRILSASGATNVQLVTLLIPFSAATLGIVFLNEPFTWRLVVGMLVICTAAALIDGRVLARRKG